MIDCRWQFLVLCFFLDAPPSEVWCDCTAAVAADLVTRHTQPVRLVDANT